VVIGGPSGAGKSTFAARVVEAPVLDPDAVRAALGGGPWEAALARFEAELAAALDRGGAVAVTTALRRGHRLRLSRLARARGREAHLLMLDADLELCRAGRAAQGQARISEGLFLHLVREWEAFRRVLATAGEPPDGFRSVRVLDRAAADALQRVRLG
jgi:predicted kinase